MRSRQPLMAQANRSSGSISTHQVDLEPRKWEAGLKRRRPVADRRLSMRFRSDRCPSLPRRRHSPRPPRAALRRPGHRRRRLTPGGRAIAPPSAPPAVKAMIEAANRIHHRPYRWGGGHRSWNSAGYDCSGSVSYVDARAPALLESPARLDRVHALGRRRGGRLGADLRQPRTRLRRHRRPALGHLLQRTTATARGPGWSEEMRPTGGFRLRAPARARSRRSRSPSGVAGQTRPTSGTTAQRATLYGGTKAREAPGH